MDNHDSQPKQTHLHPLRACGEVRSIQTIDKQVLVAKQAGLAGRIEHVVSIVGGDGAESREL